MNTRNFYKKEYSRDRHDCPKSIRFVMITVSAGFLYLTMDKPETLRDL